MTEKPIGIVLPSWNPDEPRFIVKTCKYCSDDRQFKNSKCVFNQRLGFAYSVDEIVEVLNTLGDENDQLKEELKDYSDANARLEERIRELETELNAFKPVVFQDMRKGTILLYTKECELFDGDVE